MKNQDIFPTDFFVEKFSRKLNEIFQALKTQNNFLVPWIESAVKNFNRGVDFFATQAKETTTEFTEGGIRIQENSPKSGGREET